VGIDRQRRSLGEGKAQSAFVRDLCVRNGVTAESGGGCDFFRDGAGGVDARGRAVGVAELEFLLDVELRDVPLAVVEEEPDSRGIEEAPRYLATGERQRAFDIATARSAPRSRRA
jgi:hypothetical protein